jgi:hypothetical protein
MYSILNQIIANLPRTEGDLLTEWPPGDWVVLGTTEFTAINQIIATNTSYVIYKHRSVLTSYSFLAPE